MEDGRKVPYYASGQRRHGENGSAEDRRALVAFDQAVSAYRRGGFDGIGIGLLPELNLIALDFDDCRAADGTLTGLVTEFVKASYAEVSPSGTGVRVLLRGTLPNSKSKGVEVFSTKGYVTLTGNRLNGAAICELTQEIRSRLEKVTSRRETVRVDFSPTTLAEGTRNTSLASLAGSMRRRGASQESIEAALMVENRSRGDPPLPTSEVRAIARSVARYEPARQDATITWTPATQVAADFEEWIVHGVVPQSGRMGVYAPSGEAKTAFVIDLVAHIALGRPWHGRDVDHALKVAYVATESPISVKRRFRAWARDNHVTYEAVDREVFVFEGPLDLNSPGSVEAFKRSIPDLVSMAGGAPHVWAVDTLATAMSGDENTKAIQDAVQAIYHAIRERTGRDPLVIFIHHTGKDEQREERGHSSLRATMDTSIKIEAGESTGASPTEAQPSVLIKSGVARVRKQRDGVDGQQFAFELHAVFMGKDGRGRPRSQVVVRPSTDLSAALDAAKAKRDKRSGRKTMAAAIRARFDELADGSGAVAFRDLLMAVADDVGKDPGDLRDHFNREIQRAGFTSMRERPGKPATVRRA